ncbi:MAG: tetratricopeptide repeat protein [Rhodospirillales bacterium]
MSAASPGSGKSRFDSAAALKQAAELLAQGKADMAEASLRPALRAAPAHPGMMQLLAVARARQGDLAEAETLLRQAIALEPEAAAHRVNLGIVLGRKGEFEAAIACYRAAIERQPRMTLAHTNLGNTLHKAGRSQEAVEVYRGALAIEPDDARVHFGLGRALEELERWRESEAAYRRALALQPDHALARTNLGNVLLAQKRAEEALEDQRRALAIDPLLAEAHVNRGAALYALDRFAEAEAAQRRALELNPGLAKAHKNLGMTLENLGRPDEALAAFEAALAAAPDDPDLHFTLGLSLLRAGRFERGWREYAWRWRLKEFAATRRDLAKPAWDGAALGGRTILLHAEQGQGDTIQTLRYAKLVAGRGGRVVLEVPPSLKRLSAGMEAVAQVVAAGETLPEFDVQCPLLDLPRLFDTRPETIPADTPYLAADPRAAAEWRRRLAARPGLSVGLAWAGNPSYSNDRRRSLDPALLAPLLGLERVCFYSLQVGPAADDLARAPGGEGVEKLGHLFADFADTAACIAALDLTVAVDTAVAHLAGALDRPVWILLPYAADWRWLVDRADSPWYRSATLFRQERPGDWAAVIERIREKLAS